MDIVLYTLYTIVNRKHEKVSQLNEIQKERILDRTSYVSDLNFIEFNKFRLLSEQIHLGKNNLKTKNVEFIIVQILNRQNRPYKFIKKVSFDFYVIGSYRKTFRPVKNIADAMADFFIEFKILPNVIAIPIKDYKMNEKYYLKRINNGIIIYDRERSIS